MWEALSAPPPPGPRLRPRRGEGGGCGCIFAERVLWLRRARGGYWPRCPPGSHSLRVALARGSTSRPALRAAQPGGPPRPPPSAGRAGGVVRAARVTARSSRGASTGLSVTAPNALRAQSAAGRQPWRSDVLGALASVRARPLTTRVRALVATSLLSTQRQWTREPPRRSTVGAAPVAADAGLGRVDARGRRCSWPGSGLCPGRGHLRFQSRMRGPAASLLRLGTGAHVESQQDRQRGPRLSWWPQVLDEGSKSHPLQTFLPRFQDVFWGCNSVWRLTPAGVGVGTPPTLVVQQDHYHVSQKCWVDSCSAVNTSHICLGWAGMHLPSLQPWTL